MSPTPADSFLDEAGKLQYEARQFLDKYEYHRAVEFSQRTVEFCVKAVLLLYQQKFPWTHFPAPDLRKIEGFPDWFKRKIPRIELWSRLLADSRALAIYGDPDLGVPAQGIFDRALAGAAVEAASEIHSDCHRLFLESRQTA